MHCFSQVHFRSRGHCREEGRSLDSLQGGGEELGSLQGGGEKFRVNLVRRGGSFHGGRREG